ncbi:MAG: allophanate hydrolase [Gordonia sp. (in: high G+C Gram-positive bacteria)]
MSTVDRVAAAYRRIAAVDRPEIWVTLRDKADVTADAALVDERVAAGEQLPLAGILIAVKDNIDVAGLPTTAACPSFAYIPDRDATAVARLRAAGALILGKTNLDQFATGLVGTRSPYGAVRNAWRPELISGGSSSGSAVAVALSLVDIALGTDTAGSGRVPAALNGIVGIKPTVGLVPTTGVVPACRSLDVVTVFSRDLPACRHALELMIGPDGVDPRCRDAVTPRCIGARPRIAIPLPEQLDGLADGWSAAFATAVEQTRSVGAEVAEVDIAPLLEAASLLYGGAFVAERTAAVGDFIRGRPDQVGGAIDPTVAGIVLGGDAFSAADVFADRERLDRLGMAGRRALAGFDALLTPTTTGHPSIAEVAADPVGANARMGRYTNFANLLDYSALAFPMGTIAGLPFGVMLTAPAFHDANLVEIARRLGDPRIDLLVVGAHLHGQPLNHQLVAAGGRFKESVRTAPGYRLYALPTSPPKPGLRRVGEGGRSIDGEVWTLPASGLGRFLAALPRPMGLGRVQLDDGSQVTGFLAEEIAFAGAGDISDFGGWRAFLTAQSAPDPVPSTTTTA